MFLSFFDAFLFLGGNSGRLRKTRVRARASARTCVSPPETTVRQQMFAEREILEISRTTRVFAP